MNQVQNRHVEQVLLADCSHIQMETLGITVKVKLEDLADAVICYKDRGFLLDKAETICDSGVLYMIVQFKALAE